MAINGSTSVQVTAYDTLKFNWAQKVQSTPNNYTVVTWNLQLISGSAGKIISTASKAWSVTVNGTVYSDTNSVAIENNTTKTLASGETVIAHNNDGTKSFSYSFSQEFGITFAGASVGTKTGSGTGTLNTIPRATQPSLHTSSIDMGGTVTIYTPRASDAFTHDLSYSFAGGAYQTIQTGVTTSVYWLVPLTLANSIPNTASGTVTIRCITKNGTTTVGEKTVLLTAKVPATVIPTISTVSHTEAATGLPSGIGGYVQSKSKIKATITAAGAYSSTIKSYSSTFQGKTYTGASFTSDTVTQSGSMNIVTTVTDSRGRSASKTTAISVLGYEPPKIGAFRVTRRNSSGAADPNGQNVQIAVSYSVTSLNSKNTASAKIEYKNSTATTWTTLETRTALSMTGTISPTTTFSIDYQWDFRVTLSDAFKAEAVYTTYIPSGAVILDIKADGKGIAFFKTSTKDGVEIAGELPGSAISLTSNTNLDTLKTPGFYVIPTGSIALTVSNKPYTDAVAASIRVERTGDGMIKQIVQKSTKTDGVIYERGYDSSGWGTWNVVYAGEGKILWTGSSLLTGSQTVAFSEKVSVQQNGIVLVFSRYIGTTAVDYFYSCHFVPKLLITAAKKAGQSTAAVTFIMATNKFEAITGKYLRIEDSGITGDDANSASGTLNGVTYNNDRFALRYVIGV